MAAQTEDTSVVGQSAESPGSASTFTRGQRPDSYYRQSPQKTLVSTAARAARVLEDHIWQVKGQRDLKTSLQRACEYVIDHAVGKPRQKIEHSGAVLTYGEVAKSAEGLATKGRAVLADAEAIADGYAGSDAAAPVAEAEPASKLGDV